MVLSPCQVLHLSLSAAPPSEFRWLATSAAGPARKRLIEFNRRFYNPTVRRLAAMLPTMGVLYHTGRKSGKEYRTVLNVFRCQQGYAIAIAYGRESDWVRNVLRSGSCYVVTMGKRVHLVRPRIVVDETRRLVPRLWRPMLRWLKIADFLVLEPQAA